MSLQPWDLSLVPIRLYKLDPPPSTPPSYPLTTSSKTTGYILSKTPRCISRQFSRPTSRSRPPPKLSISRGSHSAPVERCNDKRSALPCNIISALSQSSEADTHLPNPDWKSNYIRAKKSLNMLRLVKFQNWDPQPKAVNNDNALITQWVCIDKQ